MTRVWSKLTVRFLFMFVMFFGTNAGTLMAQQNDSAEPSQQGSLLRVPETTGLYIATMNHGPLIEAVTNSNAWKSIKASDVAKGMKRAYRRGKTRGYADYNEDNPFAIYLKGYGDTIDSFMFQSVWMVAKQVVGNELFVYVDNDTIPFAKAVRDAQAEMLQSVGADDIQALDEGISGENSEAFVKIFKKHFADVKCPTLLMGSRLDDPEGFRGLLEMARSSIESGINSLPPTEGYIRDAFKVVEAKKHYLLLFDVEFENLPWEDLMVSVGDEQLVDSMIELTQGKRAAVAVGIVDNLLVMGMAHDQDRLIEFGDSPRLVDLPKLKRLKSAIDQDQAITSVYYVSEEYANAAATLDQMIKDQVPMIKSLITSEAAGLGSDSGEIADQVGAELTDFANDIKTLMPKPGMSYGFTAMGPEGIHGYRFQKSAHPGMDGSKPLKLVSHAGPETMAFMVQRPAKLREQYEFATKWGAKLYQYVTENAVDDVFEAMEAERAANEAMAAQERQRLAAEAGEEIDAESDVAQDEKSEAELAPGVKLEREQIEAILKGLEACVTSMDQTTRELFLPAIEKQEMGLFLEMATESQRIHPAMPEGMENLPIPLPALVMETRDANSIVKAYEQYWTALEAFRKIVIKNVPKDQDMENFEMLPPVRSEVGGGTAFRWNVFGDPDIDSWLKPGSWVGQNLIVLNLHQGQAEKMAKQRKPDLFGPVANQEASFNAFFYDHRVTMDAIEKWWEYGVSQSEDQGVDLDLSSYEAERDTLQFTEEQLLDACDRVWTLLKCWEGISGRTYSQSGGMATEFLFKFQDISGSD